MAKHSSAGGSSGDDDDSKPKGGFFNWLRNKFTVHRPNWGLGRWLIALAMAMIGMVALGDHTLHHIHNYKVAWEAFKNFNLLAIVSDPNTVGPVVTSLFIEHTFGVYHHTVEVLQVSWHFISTFCDAYGFIALLAGSAISLMWVGLFLGCCVYWWPVFAVAAWDAKALLLAMLFAGCGAALMVTNRYKSWFQERR